MSLQTSINIEGQGKNLASALDEETRKHIDKTIKGFTCIADNRGLREYFSKLPENAKDYIKSADYWWQVQAALRWRA